MTVRLVGRGESADLRVEPIGFEGIMQVRALVPPGAADVDERLAVARFRCQNGGPQRTGQDCLLCGRYRGWRDGPDEKEITIHCSFTDRESVSARMTLSSAISTVSPETTWKEAEALAARAGVHHLLVTVEGRLIGVTCGCEFGKHADDEPVRASLGPNVFVIEASASLGEAAAAMAELRIGCLPVLDDGKLAGVITRNDLRRAGVSADLLGE